MKYTSVTTSRTPRPRSPRLRGQGIGGAGRVGSTVVLSGAAGGTGGTPTGDGHTHANKSALDQISTDSDGYGYLTRLVEVEAENAETEWQSRTEKVKAGFADQAHDLTPDSPVRAQFLSRVADDVARGRITFQEGLVAVARSMFNDGIDVAGTSQFGAFTRADDEYSGAAITPQGLGDFVDLYVRNVVRGGLTVEDAVRASQIFFSGLLASAGAIEGSKGIFMDAAAGRIETDALEVRGWMRVEKLIYNMLQLMESDYSFTEGGDIERVEELGEGVYRLYMHKEKEGRHTAFADGDIIYGKVDELQDGGLYYTSWLTVLADGVTLRDGMEPDELRVSMWADGSVPGGRNFPPKAMMTVTRWGNVSDPERQTSWMLSATDKRLVMLRNVSQPILQPANYAIILGQLPRMDNVLPSTIDYSKPMLYAGGLVVDHSNIHHINFPVPEEYTVRDRGDWQQGTEYRHGIVNKDNGEKERVTDQVRHNGGTWQCLVDETADEPTPGSASWVRVGGGSDGKNGEDAVNVQVLSNKGAVIKNGDDSDYELTAYVFKGSTDISATLRPDAFSWERTSSSPEEDAVWNLSRKGIGRTLKVDKTDVLKMSMFDCVVDLTLIFPED